MEMMNRSAPEIPGDEVPHAAFAPEPQGSGVRFAVVVDGELVSCVVTGDALDEFDAGRHPNLRPLGVYELYQPRIDRLAAELRRELGGSVIITRDLARRALAPR